MENLKLSVIMPAYNEGKQIKKILDKIVSLNNGKFELIVVDDGSTDCSPEILDEYAGKNKFITVFHQENQGCVFARKTGIMQAAGEFITFLDADDTIDDEYFVNFEHAVSHNADYYILNNKLVSQNEELYKEKDFLKDGYIEKEIATRWVLTNKAGAVWDKIYKTNLIKEVVKKLKLKIVFGDDVFINIIYLENVDMIYCQNSSSYIHNRNSLTSVCKQYTYKRLDEIDLLSFYILKNFDFKDNLNLKNEFCSIVVYNYIETICNLMKVNEIKEIYAYLDTLDSYKVLRNTYVPKGVKNKIYYLVLMNRMTGLMSLVFKMKNWRWKNR